LLKKANIETYGRQVKFHGLRKFLYDTLSKKDETIAKVITAKKTSASDITYKTSLDSECQRIFRECYKDFCLNGDVSGKTKKEQTERIDSLEQAMKQLESENTAFKTRIDLLQQTTKEQLDYITQIDGRLQERDRELAKLGYRFDETTKELASIKKLIAGLIPKESEEQAS
jgi:chromosome segregation ATPase